MFSLSGGQFVLFLIVTGHPLPARVSNHREAIGKLKTLAPVSISPSVYPAARRNETIVDSFSGTKVLQVADPYRWLEDPDAPETRQFVSELNAISEPFLAKSPNRKDIWKK
ncbi:hypothetical protein ANCDUO_04573 [Ancylostoma duodenale]|uniref:Peptidase S9A N-terminal domain-containing protein n=1 Tax=Ancylostoma duodenale TaxID=51022 RepID=A0A0C2H0N7_9BILA|nr:hypothetical protein ANCDUO_04573 [Ancylostoma duodenale]